MASPPSSRPLGAVSLPAGALAAVALSLCLSVSFITRGPGSTSPGTPSRTSATTVEAQPAPASRPETSVPPGPPSTLSGTGFFSPAVTRFAYYPQYPLWSDGAAKRRFIALPPGQAIDGSNPDDWQVPVGTRFWKEFSFGGQRVETRYLEKLPDGSFRFATYVWDAALGDAVLAPEAGVRNAHPIAAGVMHDIPSRADCRACHDGRRSTVLGFNALQLSSDRDPLAPHAEAVPPDALDLRRLVEQGLLRHFPQELVDKPPRIAAASATARAAKGYLFGNCSGCHNARGPLADVGLDFDQSVTTAANFSSIVGQPSRFRIPGERASLRIDPGHPRRSAVWFRMNESGAAHMPPLGTKLVDRAGTDLVASFIAREPAASHPNQGQ